MTFFGPKLHHRECVTHRSIVRMQDLKIRAKFWSSWKKTKECFQYFLAPVVVQCSTFSKKFKICYALVIQNQIHIVFTQVHGTLAQFFFKSVTCCLLYALVFHSRIVFQVHVIILLKELFPSAKSHDRPEQASSCYCYLVINRMDTILGETSLMSKSSNRIFLTVSLSTFSV